MLEGLHEVTKQVERLTAEVKAKGPPPAPPMFQVKGETRSYTIVKPDSSLEERPLPLPCRAHQASTVAALAGIVRHVMAGAVEVEPLPPAASEPRQDAAADEEAKKAWIDVALTAQSNTGFFGYPLGIPGTAEAYAAVLVKCPRKKEIVKDNPAHFGLPLSERLEVASAALRVCVVFDAAWEAGAYRKERAWLNHDGFRTLAALHYLETVRPRLDQEDMIALLRDELDMRESALLTQVRSIKMTKGEGGRRTITAQKDSLGGDSDAELVSDHGTFPDTVAVRFNALAGLDTEVDAFATVTCTFTVHPRDATFQLTPIPGDVAAAVKLAELAVCQGLERLANVTEEARPPAEPAPILVAFCGQEQS